MIGWTLRLYPTGVASQGVKTPTCFIPTVFMSDFIAYTCSSNIVGTSITLSRAPHLRAHHSTRVIPPPQIPPLPRHCPAKLDQPSCARAPSHHMTHFSTLGDLRNVTPPHRTSSCLRLLLDTPNRHDVQRSPCHPPYIIKRC